MRLLQKILLAFVFLVPILLSAQEKYEIYLDYTTPVTRKMRLEGFDYTCPPQHVVATLSFDQPTETVTVKLQMQKKYSDTDCDYLWIPQEEHYFSGLSEYFKSKGCDKVSYSSKIRKQVWKLKTNSKIDKFGQSVECDSCSMFDNEFAISNASLDLEKPINTEWLAADGKSEMTLKFKVLDKSQSMAITLKNVVPIIESSKNKNKIKPKMMYIAKDLSMLVRLQREACSDRQKDIKDLTAFHGFIKEQHDRLVTILGQKQNYEEKYNNFNAIQTMAMDKLNELDFAKYENSGCEVIDSIMDLISDMKFVIPTFRMLSPAEICDSMRNEIVVIDSIKAALAKDMENLNILKSGVKTAEGNEAFFQEKGVVYEKIKDLDLSDFKSSLCPEMAEKASSLQDLINEFNVMQYKNAADTVSNSGASKKAVLTKKDINDAIASLNAIFNQWVAASDDDKPRYCSDFNNVAVKMSEKIRIVSGDAVAPDVKDAINEFNTAVKSLMSLME